MSTDNLSPTTNRSLRIIARLVASVWAAFWTVFVWASVLSEGVTSRGITAALFLSLIFIGSALTPWFSERVGGLLLTIEGLCVLIGYPQLAPGIPSSTTTLVFLTLALPPLVAGTLYLACRERATK